MTIRCDSRSEVYSVFSPPIMGTTMATNSHVSYVMGKIATMGVSEIIVETITEPKMRKTDNPYYGGVTKVSRVRLKVNLPPEGDLPWGQRVDGTSLITHKGEAYVQGEVVESLGYEYRYQGVLISPETVHSFLPPLKEGDSKIRTYKISNISAINEERFM